MSEHDEWTRHDKDADLRRQLCATETANKERLVDQTERDEDKERLVDRTKRDEDEADRERRRQSHLRNFNSVF